MNMVLSLTHKDYWAVYCYWGSRVPPFSWDEFGIGSHCNSFWVLEDEHALEIMWIPAERNATKV